MNVRFSRVLAFALCLTAIIFFWNIRDRGSAAPLGAYASTAAPLSRAEVSKEAVSFQEAFVKVAGAVKPAVVNIHAIQMVDVPSQEFYYGDQFEDFFNQYFGGGSRSPRKQQKQQRKQREEGSGSGVIIDDRGYILTNEHVVHNADEIKVRVFVNDEEKTYTGKVVGKDTRTDIAIVKISAKGLTAAALGDSDKIRVGEWVIAIGAPFGLEQTVTAGIISANRQSITIEGKVYRDFIQTDTAINRGNSGGPLCNIYGEVIGINTAIYAPTGVFSGVGFAIPINQARSILQDLINNGKVVRGWLGIEIKGIDDAIARQFGLPDKRGVLVNSVMKNSPAERGGLRRGDVIREFNGRKVDSPEALQDAVGSLGPKKTVSVGVFRDGSVKALRIITGEMPQENASASPEEGGAGGDEGREEGATASWMDVKVTPLTADLAKQYNVPADEKGVVIAEIGPDSKARDIGLEEGDLVKSINRKPTDTLENFKAVTKKISLADGVVFDIIRNGQPLYLSYTSPE